MFHDYYTYILHNNIDGVMVSVLALSTVDGVMVSMLASSTVDYKTMNSL
jgi:hypothetical protein